MMIVSVCRRRAVDVIVSGNVIGYGMKAVIVSVFVGRESCTK